jgi:hypothetical protein
MLCASLWRQCIVICNVTLTLHCTLSQLKFKSAFQVLYDHRSSGKIGDPSSHRTIYVDVPHEVAKTFLPEDDPAVADTQLQDGMPPPPFVTFKAVKRNNAILDIICTLLLRGAPLLSDPRTPLIFIGPDSSYHTFPLIF